MADYYPPVGFHFKVDFSDVGKGDADTRFQEVSGISSEMVTEELQIGGENSYSLKLPVRARYNNLILKRGLLYDSGLISWFTKAIEEFDFKPVDVSVYLLNENHKITQSWIFVQAYPVKWTVSDFRAQDNALAIETIELAYQLFRRK